MAETSEHPWTRSVRLTEEQTALSMSGPPSHRRETGRMKDSTRKRLESLGLLSTPDRTASERRRDAVWIGAQGFVLFATIGATDAGFVAGLGLAVLVGVAFAIARAILERRRFPKQQ